MSGPFGSSQWMYNAGGGFYDYKINDSLRFNDDDSAYLNRTPASAGNRRTWTWSGWVKRGNLVVNSSLFSAAGNYYDLRFTTSDTLLFYGNGSDLNFQTITVYRDPSAWYHVVVALDTTQSTALDRVKIYVNGEQQTSFSSSVSALNAELAYNNTVAHAIGRRESTSNFYADSYLSDINFIDGQALDPTSFGETKDGVWIPKAYGGSYGTNGFHLDFSNNSTATNLGLDSSGNSNNWSVNGIATTDQMIDTPTNNFATFNPLMYRWVSNTTTLSEGNLKSTGSSGYAFGTMNIPTSGKWYFETYTVAGTSVGTVGVGDGNLLQNSSVSDVVYYFSNGNKSVNGTVTSYGATWTTGDVIGVACDSDSGTVTFYKNGSSQGSISYDPSEKTVFFGNWGTTGYFVLNHGQDSTFAGATTAGGNADGNGVGDFKYSVPSSHLALCTKNLTEPVVGPLGDSLSDENFNTVLYTGTTGDDVITGVGFQPNLVWLKHRNGASSPQWYDSIRGATNYLLSSSTGSQGTDASTLKSFDTDGFTVGDNAGAGANGGSYVAWNWKAGGTASSNTDGSITSQVSANVDAGFSIVSYTGTGANATVGHSLGAQPDMVIVKVRSTTNNWATYVKELGNTKALLLDTTDAALTSSLFWNNTTPTSSVFSVSTGNSVNNSGQTYIAYCFADVEGFSKAGSYTGNGSTNGPFIYTGFRPAWVMIKASSTTGNWFIVDTVRDPFNPTDDRLYPNLSNVESDFTSLDSVSNGFKVRNSFSDMNTSGQTYIFLAFAENPFKYANAR